MLTMLKTIINIYGRMPMPMPHANEIQARNWCSNFLWRRGQIGKRGREIEKKRKETQNFDTFGRKVNVGGIGTENFSISASKVMLRTATSIRAAANWSLKESIFGLTTTKKKKKERGKKVAPIVFIAVAFLKPNSKVLVCSFVVLGSERLTI